jgi:hypothetical protein
MKRSPSALVLGANIHGMFHQHESRHRDAPSVPPVGAECHHVTVRTSGNSLWHVA